MEEPFSFSPVDKIPAKPGNYKARPLEKWNWLDFYNYFDDSHAQMVGKAPWLSMKEKGKKKKIIEKNNWFKKIYKTNTGKNKNNSKYNCSEYSPF